LVPSGAENSNCAFLMGLAGTTHPHPSGRANENAPTWKSNGATAAEAAATKEKKATKDFFTAG
jgi:hypothetical protein